ncbi:hypothetical protein GmHk_05G013338 [Glycine max]|nr:hypothetical protein GmHk_05G013338 [Glycine max]
MSFTSKNKALLLTFSFVATFPNDTNKLLFLAPNPSLSLLHFQSQLCDAIKIEGISYTRLIPRSPYCSVHHVPINFKLCTTSPSLVMD